MLEGGKEGRWEDGKKVKVGRWEGEKVGKREGEKAESGKKDLGKGNNWKWKCGRPKKVKVRRWEGEKVGERNIESSRRIEGLHSIFLY